jgi:hypothetical protein
MVVSNCHEVARYVTAGKVDMTVSDFVVRVVLTEVKISINIGGGVGMIREITSADCAVRHNESAPHCSSSPTCAAADIGKC